MMKNVFNIREHKFKPIVLYLAKLAVKYNGYRKKAFLIYKLRMFTSHTSSFRNLLKDGFQENKEEN